MLTYWKITFTLLLITVLTYEIDRFTRKLGQVEKDTPTKIGGVANFMLLAFMIFICVGLTKEVWA